MHPTGAQPEDADGFAIHCSDLCRKLVAHRTLGYYADLMTEDHLMHLRRKFPGWLELSLDRSEETIDESIVTEAVAILGPSVF